MKVAIGIPAFKAEKTISKCLSSINIQSMRDDINVIIANDNPGDDYHYLSKEFPELHITYVDCEKNGGPGVARNNALKASNDDTITFIDADDVFYTPYAIETMYNAFRAPGTIQAQTVFVQECTVNGEHKLMPQTNPGHPWVFGRLTSVQFLKQNNIDFGTLRQMEDGRFEWCIRLLTEGTQYKITPVQDITYVWKEGSEHSITRSGMDINDGIPVYNYGLCQIGASRAAKEAIEFALEKNPFNGNIQKFAVEQMVGHYFTYYECLERCPKFAEQNWWLSKWFYNTCYSKYCQNITDDLLDQFYMGMLSVKGKDIKHFPELTFKQWFNKIKQEEFKLEELIDIRSRLPENIVQVEKKTGTITDDILGLFQ